MNIASQIDTSGPVPAASSWLLTLVLVVTAIRSVGHAAPVWAGFVGLSAAVAALPAAITGDWRATVPLAHLFVFVVAVLVRATGAYLELTGYVAVAALATVVVVELDAFTDIEMTRRFAVAFGVLTTLALQGWWTVAQFYSDRWFGTDLLTTQLELQLDLVAVSVVALVLGLLSELYLETVSTDEPTRGTPG